VSHRERIVVVSPHCDDGVFGCGDLLATHPGTTVVTAFAGRPKKYERLTRWDEACGFRPGDDPVAIRQREDHAALALLGAVPVWLEFCDSQYGASPAPDVLAGPLAAAIAAARPTAVIAPLGLFHSDHVLAHEAALVVARERPALAWIAYEDAIYRRIPDLVARRIALLAAAGLAPRPVSLPVAGTDARKGAAIACYRSQLRALAAPGHPGWSDALAPGSYWRLTP